MLVLFSEKKEKNRSIDTHGYNLFGKWKNNVLRVINDEDLTRAEKNKTAKMIGLL